MVFVHMQLIDKNTCCDKTWDTLSPKKPKEKINK